jgi:hypothetical protein
VSAVVIAASNLMASLCKHLADEGELLTFADSEPIQALQAILERRPSADRPRAAVRGHPARRGAHQPHQDRPAAGRHAEVRVMSHTGDYTRVVARSSAAPADRRRGESAPSTGAAVEPRRAAPSRPAEAARPLDWHGTRRAPRVRVRDGVEIQLDGNPASVVDLSTVGAQVRLVHGAAAESEGPREHPQRDFVMRFRGAIAWAKFELSRGSAPPVYRAGVEFADADAPGHGRLLRLGRPHRGCVSVRTTRTSYSSAIPPNHCLPATV